MTYDGPALEGHEIAARDLAPALVAVSDVLEAANAALNGNDVRVQVNVRASFRTGCFGIDFSVVQSLTSQLTHLLTGDTVTAASNLITLLGFAGGTVVGCGKGLVWVVKRLRGRSPRRVVELKNGRFRIEVDDDAFEVEAEVLELLRNYDVRRGLEAMVKPLEEEGIDKLVLQDDIEGEPEVISKSERHWFKAPSLDEEMLEEREDERWLQLVTVSFKEENKWRFYDGNSTFFASILDENFLRRVDLDEEKFGKNDVLRVRLRTRQYIDPSGNMRLEAEVLEVLEKKSAGRQLRLPISGESDDPPSA